jgi:hypothetical protein
MDVHLLQIRYCKANHNAWLRCNEEKEISFMGLTSAGIIHVERLRFSNVLANPVLAIFISHSL